MLASNGISRRSLVAIAAGIVVWAVQPPARVSADEQTSLHVVVKDAETGQPINQAHLTLQFRDPGSKTKLKRSKPLSFSAKTNYQGRYRFVNVPKGSLHLIVTAERHQTFGRDFELEEDNQVIEVKMKKPQPLL